MTHVPDANARPGSGVSVTGPSLVVRTSHRGRVRELNALPAPATVGLGTATLLTNANGGTEYSGSPATSVDFAGNLWSPQSANQWGPKLRSNPGNHVLGQNTLPAVSNEAGWPSSSYRSGGGGGLRRGDGLGSDLPKDGTTVGARFLTAANAGSITGRTHVWESTRVDASNVTSVSLFDTLSNSQHHRIKYVRDTGGDEWFVLFASALHTGDSFTLKLFASDTSGAVDTPTMPFDIGPDIVAGAGWHHANSRIQDVAVDWDNSQILVLDAGVYGNPNPFHRTARIHVFTLEEEVRPVPEPAGLGLLGLAMLGIRKKRS